ncbi:hypothetical protein BC833DRAFT_446750 [Globomyces pollinis-pini]|nr:hypothetical protein BC833DRAFT_446750 [Globomyces pollinis-pini]
MEKLNELDFLFDNSKVLLMTDGPPSIPDCCLLDIPKENYGFEDMEDESTVIVDRIQQSNLPNQQVFGSSPLIDTSNRTIPSKVQKSTAHDKSNHLISKSESLNDKTKTDLTLMRAMEERKKKALEKRNQMIKDIEMQYQLELAMINKEFNDSIGNTEDDSICTLCYSNWTDQIIQPCLHAICSSCSAKISDVCPWDRMAITGYTNPLI